MDLYTAVSYKNARQLTLAYSSSFGLSSRFFSATIRPHIYALYGLVRIADEVVDTYRGPDARIQLDALEQDTYDALDSGYSTSPIIHAFAQTARIYGIDKTLIAPFFSSMRTDLEPQTYSSSDYERYIHGSAEVVGLMCLRVFVEGDTDAYDSLKPGAVALGSAYQKVNFLRDLAADYKELGRTYFPDVSYETFDDVAKARIVADIQRELKVASEAIRRLPSSSKKATLMSYVYYSELLRKLDSTPAVVIKTRRIRVSSVRKAYLLIRTALFGTRA